MIVVFSLFLGSEILTGRHLRDRVPPRAVGPQTLLPEPPLHLRREELPQVASQ